MDLIVNLRKLLRIGDGISVLLSIFLTPNATTHLYTQTLPAFLRCE